MKFLIACTLFVASTIAEPPVDNRYLPPQQGFNGNSLAPPSQSYGPPGAGSGFGAQRHTDAVFRGRPSQNYGAPLNQRSRSPQYRAPSQPSSQYGAPSQPSSQYSAPSTQYGAPSQIGNQFGRQEQNRPGVEYGAPAPSQQYGAPGFGSAGSNPESYRRGEQSRQYLPPGRGGYAGDDGSSNEPANYSFEYMVKDEESGNDFGHRESRQGDRAEGLYYVLLPDGRKQTVEYEADQDGYKPRISYEDTGLGSSYDRNGQSGYQNQGPY